MKRFLILCLAALLSSESFAQDESAFQFLRLPMSAHAAALGGDNVSVIDDDHTLAFCNPALLSAATGGTLNLSYMSYLQGSTVAGASYNMNVGDRSSFAIAGQYMGFGNMQRTDYEGSIYDEFSAKDMDLSATYCYNLSDCWSGGVTAKFIYSNYDIVYSLAVGVDLGLNYYDPESGTSFSLVARQLGGQVKSYDDLHESLPFNCLMGISKELAHAPVRLSLTLTDLNRWKGTDFYGAANDSFKDILFRHFIVGADIFPSENIWVAVGYNQMLHKDLSLTEGRSMAGFSLGAGINVNRIKVGVSYGRYHVAANSLLMNISYGL